MTQVSIKHGLFKAQFSPHKPGELVHQFERLCAQGGAFNLE